MTTSTAQPVTPEPTLRLPTARLLAVPVAAAIVAGAGWTCVCLLLGQPSSVVLVGAWSAAIISVAMVAGVLVLVPWKPRPVSMLMSLWLGGMMVRFIIAAGLAWLLYSATRPGEWPLAAGVGGTYFFALLCEAAMLAGHVKQETTR